MPLAHRLPDQPVKGEGGCTSPSSSERRFMLARFTLREASEIWCIHDAPCKTHPKNVLIGMAGRFANRIELDLAESPSSNEYYKTHKFGCPKFLRLWTT